MKTGRRAFWTLTAALALAGAGMTEPPGPDAKVADTPPPPSETVKKLLDAHNRERSKAELPPLALDAKLTAATEKHAKDMAEHGKMAHEGSDGSSPFDRMKRAGYEFQGAGENVAEGWRTVEEVMKGWMESPPHKENVLGKFEQAGMAVARDDDGNPYWCVDFGRPWPKVEPAKASGGLVDAINARRVKEKKAALTPNETLNTVAARIAGELAKADSLDAGKNAGAGVVEALDAAGYRYRKLAEAAATGQGTAEEVVATWMDSDAHKANLLGDFLDAGAGYARAKSGQPYWCLILARPAGR